MGFTYKPLWKLLIDRGMKKKDLKEQIALHSTTIAKMGRDEFVAMEVLDKICTHLNCRIEDIIKHVPDER